MLTSKFLQQIRAMNRNPRKGEPPPTTTYSKPTHWLGNVIQNIIDNNQNITLPCARLIFDTHNIPTISSITAFDTKSLIS